jgi:integrase
MNSTTRLDALAQIYWTVRPLSRGAKYQIDRTIRLFGEWLARPASTEDLEDLTVSEWLESLGADYAGWTVSGHRTRLLCLWRFAARRKLCEPPGEVRRCPPPLPMPRAWTVEQVGDLLRAAESLGGIQGRYLHALIRAAYETGLRRGDLFALERGQISPDGAILVRQHKTMVPHVVAVRPETAAEILALPGDYPLKPPFGSKRYGRYWDEVRRRAGLPSGACQQLRRTGATWVARENGEDAARSFLGHRSPEMLAHYLDRSVTQQRPYLPPRAG